MGTFFRPRRSRPGAHSDTSGHSVERRDIAPAGGPYRLPQQPTAADADHAGVPVRVSIRKLDTQIRHLPARDRRARVLAALCVHDQLVPDSRNPLDGNFVWNKHWRARRMRRDPAARAMYDQAMAEFRSTPADRYR